VSGGDAITTLDGMSPASSLRSAVQLVVMWLLFCFVELSDVVRSVREAERQFSSTTTTTSAPTTTSTARKTTTTTLDDSEETIRVVAIVLGTVTGIFIVGVVAFVLYVLLDHDSHT